jgi:dienelactone hydrolase
MKNHRRIFFALCSSTLLFGCQSIEHRSQITEVPVPGAETKLVTTVFYPKGEGPFPVAILNHGTPAGDKGRRAMGRWLQPEPVNALIERGYVVAIPMRRGFGATGGRYNGSIGGCADPKFYRGSLGAAEDIVAAVEYVKTLPSVDGGRILLVGHSAGGIASMAAASMQPDGVRAVMNFSGGRGSGRSGSKRGVPCYPERMADAIGRYAQTIDAPVLWYYVEDDSYFGPEVVRSWFESFRQNGGKGELVFHPGSSISDGHQFIKKSGSSRDWGPVLDKFLSSVSF